MSIVIGPVPLRWAESLQYSQPVGSGGLVWTAGQGGFDAGGTVVGGIESQTRQAFANLDAALRACGGCLDLIVRWGVNLVEAADYDDFQRVRAEVVSPLYPASTAVVVAALLIEGMHIEIDAAAVVGARREVAR